MKLYHGSNTPVEAPDVTRSRSNLDFGRGFYATSFRQQAESWAQRKAIRTKTSAVISVFEFSEDCGALSVLKFSDDAEWLDFVCSCRRGSDDYLAYDLIIGPVADDRVYNAVDMYFRGIWDARTTLEAVRFYKCSDQYCFVSQRAVDNLLRFRESYEVSHD